MCKPKVLLERNFVEDLNDYFADVCYDPGYEEQFKLDISAAFETPQLDYDQVCNALRSINGDRVRTVCDKSHGVDRSYGKQLIAKVDIQRHKYHTCNRQSF